MMYSPKSPTDTSKIGTTQYVAPILNMNTQYSTQYYPFQPSEQLQVTSENMEITKNFFEICPTGSLLLKCENKSLLDKVGLLDAEINNLTRIHQTEILNEQQKYDKLNREYNSQFNFLMDKIKSSDELVRTICIKDKKITDLKLTMNNQLNTIGVLESQNFGYLMGKSNSTSEIHSLQQKIKEMELEKQKDKEEIEKLTNSLTEYAKANQNLYEQIYLSEHARSELYAKLITANGDQTLKACVDQKN